MKFTKIILTIVMTFIITLCTACESTDDRMSRELDIKEEAYDEGYQAGYEAAQDDYNVFDGSYDDGYEKGMEAGYDIGYSDACAEFDTNDTSYTETENTSQTSDMVYVTCTGSKYHRENCGFVKNKNDTTSMPKEEAEKICLPCNRCNP